MSRYDKEPLDFTALKTIPIRDRGGQVRIEDFARAYQKGAGLGGWLEGLPRILAGDAFCAVVDAVAAARAKGKASPVPVILITYATSEDAVYRALQAVQRDKVITGRPQVIRIEKN